MKVFCSTFLIISPLLVLPVILNNKKPIWSGDWFDNLFLSRGIDLNKVEIPDSNPTDCDKNINCLSKETINNLLKKINSTS